MMFNGRFVRIVLLLPVAKLPQHLLRGNPVAAWMSNAKHVVGLDDFNNGNGDGIADGLILVYPRDLYVYIYLYVHRPHIKYERVKTPINPL